MRFVIINMAPYSSQVSLLTSRAPSLSVIQDTGSGDGDLTNALDGDKDDMYLFLADGTLHHFENEGWDLGSSSERAAFVTAVDALIATSTDATTVAPTSAPPTSAPSTFAPSSAPSTIAPSLSVAPTPLTWAPTASLPPTSVPAPAPTALPTSAPAPAPTAPPTSVPAPAPTAPTPVPTLAAASSDSGDDEVDASVIVIISAAGALVLGGTAFFLNSHKKAVTQPSSEKHRNGASIEIAVVSGEKAGAVQMQA